MCYQNRRWETTGDRAIVRIFGSRFHKCLGVALAVALAWGVGLTSGCSDLGELGGGFGRGDTFAPPGDDDVVDLSYPIEAGDAFHHLFGRSYVVDVSATGTCGGQTGGESVDELSAQGHLCTRIEAVDDGYADNEPTTLTAEARITGADAQNDIDIGRVDDAGCQQPVTGEEVDAATAPLWLTAATAAARGHGLADPQGRTFSTQAPALPPDHVLTRLLFFDPREAADKSWRGWNDAAGDVAGARSFTGEIIRYFIDTYGYEFFSDATQFHHRFNEPAAGCPGLDEASCTGGCEWDGATCRSRPVFIELGWRETIAAGAGPAELEGPVLHSLRLEYRWDGSLAWATEYIKKDNLTGTEALPSFSQLHNCTPIPTTEVSGPCAEASVRALTEAFAAAPCAF